MAENINERTDIPDFEIQKVMEEVKKEQPLDNTNTKVQFDSSVVHEAEEEAHHFDAQVDSLLSILINSVYSSKDYFLRELVSNASDANDKRKRLANSQGETIDEELTIKIVPSKEQKTITITDNGIGMSKADMINYLGSIATSGTKEFKKKLSESEDKDMGALIGQFGLGFYSAFLVADQVDVISKRQEDSVHIWSSRGPGGFVIAPYHSDAPIGTSVILHISEKCQEYLEDKKLEDLVKVHSAFIEHPIYLHTLTTKTRKVAKKEDEATEVKEESDAVEEEMKEEEEETYTEEEDKHLNSQKPLWARNPRESKISEEEYETFYKTFTNDWEKHFAVSHSHIEGDVEMQVLLFVPSRPPFNMFEKKTKADNIKLYVQNVLVTSDLSEAVPEWMSFVRGVIGSKDLPMNVSREILQGKNVMNLIKRVLVKKVIDMVIDISKNQEEYQKFYKNFGSSLKLGIYHETGETPKKLASLLRFQTTKSNGAYISLDDYIKNMKQDQNQILIITGNNNLEELKSSPYLDGYQDYEVIYMDDNIDEFVVQSLGKYKDIELQRITSEGVTLPGQASMEEAQAEFATFLTKAKEVLGEDVEKVSVSATLKNAPCTVASGKYAYSPAMLAIIKSQPGGQNNPMLSGGFMNKKTFVINPSHSIVVDLKEKLTSGDDEGFATGLRLIFETSLLECGYPLSKPSLFTAKVFSYIEAGLKK
ncbi:molecular chaperone HtpG [Nematocida displodere]|uniref:Molecular chaperone HtpG n=1 Tax=Nematocida displodere TaxID=1805483 RepID=A0A177EDP5_9MICR|nr:molecular chaperone HtpG [Nematocida displodere]